MKQLLSALALAALATGASAQVTFTGGTDRANFANYDPNGAAAALAPTGGKEDATITTTAGVLTATFLGFEAVDSDTFTFNLGAFGTLNNKGALNASISGPVAAGLLNFSFADLFQSTSVGNGGNPGSDFTSYAVLGRFNGAVFAPATLGVYDLIIGFNDGLRVDADYDDMVVGLKVVAVPEPETYALLLAGLGAVGFIARRRQVSRQS